MSTISTAEVTPNSKLRHLRRSTGAKRSRRNNYKNAVINDTEPVMDFLFESHKSVDYQDEPLEHNLSNKFKRDPLIPHAEI